MRVDRESWTITVWYDPTVTSPATLERAIEAAAADVDASERP